MRAEALKERVAFKSLVGETRCAGGKLFVLGSGGKAIMYLDVVDDLAEQSLAKRRQRALP
jgi:hypothetical protein